MLYYTATATCDRCDRRFRCYLVATAEPAPGTVVWAACPSHDGPVPVAFDAFTPTDPLSPEPSAACDPPPPPQRWWPFRRRRG